MAEVTNLITKFSFEGSTGPLKDYNSALGKGIGLLSATAVALGVAAFAVVKWASGVSQSLQPLFDLSSQTGIAVASLQELSFVAEQSSSSSQALESSISSLSAKIGEAAQKGSEEFSRLGISVRDANGNVKDADAILGEVGNSFKRLGLSMAEQQGFAEALGIDSSLINMLGKTGAEIEALKQRARDLGITLSPEDRKGLEEYNASLAEMDAAMGGLKNLIAVAIVPELEGLAEGFSDLLADNNEWIIDGIKATIEFAKDLGAALVRLAPFILAAGAAFAIATIGTSGFAAALGFVLSPAVLIAAGILAIALVLDDLIVAFRGGDSVIANFFQEFRGFDIQPVLIGIVDGFKAAFAIVTNLVSGFFEAWVQIFSGIGDILGGNFSEGFALIGEGFMTMVDTWVEYFKSMFGGVFGWAKDAVMDILPDWVVKLIGGDSGSSDTPGGEGDPSKKTESKDPSRADGKASADSTAMQPGGAVTNVGGTSSSIEQTINMEIKTSDPERAGKAASDGLQRQLEDARTQTRGRGGS